MQGVGRERFVVRVPGHIELGCWVSAPQSFVVSDG